MCIRDSRSPGYRAPTQREALVQAVKTYQTSSQERRQAWHGYCDQHARGVRDPARLRSELIEAFFAAEGAEPGAAAA
eukprot:3286393-Alexandrium_andersonii.AAC.1